MKFSVVIPVYNREKELPKCIESVLSQTYKDFEIVIVDNGHLKINAKDEYGNTPLLRAPSVESSDGERIINLLLRNGANAKEKNNYGVSYEDLIRK